MRIRHYRFGRFDLLPQERMLQCDGVPCHLGNKAFDVLHVLVRNRHRVVSHVELMDAVWSDHAVEPNNLQVQVWALRRLIGRHWIVNFPGQGYRFVGAVEEVLDRASRTGHVAAGGTWRRAEPQRADEGLAGAPVDERRLLRWCPRPTPQTLR